jgi:hypothetical protein
MFHLGFSDAGRKCFLSKGMFHLKHYPADDAGSTACTASQNPQRHRAPTSSGWN